MSHAFELDKPTAVRVAQLLEQDGRLDAAADLWWQLCAIDPYDRHAREKVGDLAYAVHEPTMPPPGVERSRVILRLIGLSFPTARLSGAYFDSLERALAARPKRAEPGKLVIALGCGRCGSTTLAGMFAAVPDACATHENPPMVYFEPTAEQLAFHRERFRRLLQHFAVVCDVSYWWLNAQRWLSAEFPGAKFVGLVRETGSCVESFMRQGGQGRGATNSVSARDNGIWRTTPGDPSRPSYPAPEWAATDPDRARRAMLTHYINEYNDTLTRLAAADPSRVMVVRTEELNDPHACARLSEFVGVSIGVPRTSLNVGTRDDGNRLEWYY
jgi:hypothetical protein